VTSLVSTATLRGDVGTENKMGYNYQLCTTKRKYTKYVTTSSKTKIITQLK